MNKAKKLIKLLDEYIDVLCDDLNDACQMAQLHGWHSTRAEIGKQYVDEIEHARKAWLAQLEDDNAD